MARCGCGHPAAIARSIRPKGGPAFNPLIAHVGDLEAARGLARFDAQRCGWPKRSAGTAHAGVAAKTRRLPGGRSLPPRASTRVAIRVPAHPIARDILRASAGQVRPSANLSGHGSPTTQSMCKASLEGRID